MCVCERERERERESRKAWYLIGTTATTILLYYLNMRLSFFFKHCPASELSELSEVMGLLRVVRNLN